MKRLILSFSCVCLLTLSSASFAEIIFAKYNLMDNFRPSQNYRIGGSDKTYWGNVTLPGMFEHTVSYAPTGFSRVNCKFTINVDPKGIVRVFPDSIVDSNKTCPLGMMPCPNVPQDKYTVTCKPTVFAKTITFNVTVNKAE